MIGNNDSDFNYFEVEGANHFPDGVVDSPDRWERPIKYSFVEHAERMAIYNAAFNGIPTDGAKLYCPWFACADCARAIICAGIREVIGLQSYYADKSAHWDESIKLANIMLDEAGVKRRYIDHTFGIQILRQGSLITV